MIYNTKSVSLFEFVSITDSEVLSPEFTITVIYNKRAQRALGRSPEEKVKGHSVANNREPQGLI